jgi:hypothetical protein
MIDKKIVIVSAISNVSRYVPYVLRNIEHYSKIFSNTYCIFVESDSVDESCNVLKNYMDNITISYEIKSLGNLKNTIPYRTGRIATGRNVYLDIVEEKFSDWDFLLVLDFNDANIDPIDDTFILSNFQRDDWDMVCANQKLGYYDLWALRHPKLMPYDCWKMCREAKSNGLWDHVHSKFVIIPEHLPWINVESAFGGAAFIKISSIQGARHESINSDGEEECEWVSFCRKLNGGNSKIYINPKFQNQIITKSRHLP